MQTGIPFTVVSKVVGEIMLVDPLTRDPTGFFELKIPARHMEEAKISRTRVYFFFTHPTSDWENDRQVLEELFDLRGMFSITGTLRGLHRTEKYIIDAIYKKEPSGNFTKVC